MGLELKAVSSEVQIPKTVEEMRESHSEAYAVARNLESVMLLVDRRGAGDNSYQIRMKPEGLSWDTFLDKGLEGGFVYDASSAYADTYRAFFSVVQEGWEVVSGQVEAHRIPEEVAIAIGLATEEALSKLSPDVGADGRGSDVAPIDFWASMQKFGTLLLEGKVGDAFSVLFESIAQQLDFITSVIAKEIGSPDSELSGGERYRAGQLFKESQHVYESIVGASVQLENGNTFEITPGLARLIAGIEEGRRTGQPLYVKGNPERGPDSNVSEAARREDSPTFLEHISDRAYDAPIATTLGVGGAVSTGATIASNAPAALRDGVSAIGRGYSHVHNAVKVNGWRAGAAQLGGNIMGTASGMWGWVKNRKIPGGATLAPLARLSTSAAIASPAYFLLEPFEEQRQKAGDAYRDMMDHGLDLENTTEFLSGATTTVATGAGIGMSLWAGAAASIKTVREDFIARAPRVVTKYAPPIIIANGVADTAEDIVNEDYGDAAVNGAITAGAGAALTKPGRRAMAWAAGKFVGKRALQAVPVVGTAWLAYDVVSAIMTHANERADMMRVDSFDERTLQTASQFIAAIPHDPELLRHLPDTTYAHPETGQTMRLSQDIRMMMQPITKFRNWSEAHAQFRSTGAIEDPMIAREVQHVFENNSPERVEAWLLKSVANPRMLKHIVGTLRAHNFIDAQGNAVGSPDPENNLLNLSRVEELLFGAQEQCGELCAAREPEQVEPNGSSAPEAGPVSSIHGHPESSELAAVVDLADANPKHVGLHRTGRLAAPKAAPIPGVQRVNHADLVTALV